MMGFFHRLGHFGGDLHMFQIHESLAADTDRVPFDRDGNTVADLVLSIVRRRQLKLKLISLVEDGEGNWVMKSAAQLPPRTEEFARAKSRCWE